MRRLFPNLTNSRRDLNSTIDLFHWQSTRLTTMMYQLISYYPDLNIYAILYQFALKYFTISR